MGRTYSKSLNPDSIQGIWTPTLQDNSFSDGEGQTYTTQQGYYTKIGNMVFINGYLKMSSIGTLLVSGSAAIAHLPFTSANVSYAGTINCGHGASISITASVNVVGHIPASATYILLTRWSATDGTKSMLIQDITATGGLAFYGQYTV